MRAALIKIDTHLSNSVRLTDFHGRLYAVQETKWSGKWLFWKDKEKYVGSTCTESYTYIYYIPLACYPWTIDRKAINITYNIVMNICNREQ